MPGTQDYDSSPERTAQRTTTRTTSTAESASQCFKANPDEITSIADAFSVVDVPWERRKQTAAVASFVFALPLTFICLLTSLVLLLNPFTTIPMLAYAYYIYTDTSPHSGRRKSEWYAASSSTASLSVYACIYAFIGTKKPRLRFRGLTWWKHFAQYFPMSLRADGLVSLDFPSPTAI